MRALRVSQRRACRGIGRARSTQRYVARKAHTDRPLVDAMLVIARKRPRFGYRRLARMLQREGWRVRRDRVHRLCRLHGLRVARKTIRRRRLGSAENGAHRLKAERMNDVWTYDFVKDQTTDGRPIKILTVEDECTRECLALVAARSITSASVLGTLRELFARRGAPRRIRSDNGPEFIATKLRKWIEENGSATAYIEPGAPWQNARGESFNGRLRDECLNLELFTCLAEARTVLADFRQDYNERRPHSSLGYMTPAECAAKERARAWTPLRLATPASAASPHAQCAALDS